MANMSFHPPHVDVLLGLYPLAVGAHTHFYALASTNTLATRNLSLRCHNLINDVTLRTHKTFINHVLLRRILRVVDVCIAL